jgi:hypothetical protein
MLSRDSNNQKQQDDDLESDVYKLTERQDSEHFQHKKIVSNFQYHIVCGTLIAFFIGFSLIGGMFVTRVAPFDSFILLDSGYRINKGLKPHIDYNSPMGALPQLIIAFWMSVLGLTAESLSFFQPTYVLFYSIIYLIMSNNRMSGKLRLLGLISILIFTLAPCPVDESPYQTGFCEPYNRIGVTGCAIPLLLILEKTTKNNKSIILDGFLYGLLIGLQLFLKPNFFLAMLVVIPIWLINLRKLMFSSIIAMMIGVILTVITISSQFDFNLSSMMNDYIAVGEVVNEVPGGRLRSIFEVIKNYFVKPNFWQTSLSFIVILLYFVVHYALVSFRLIENLSKNRAFLMISEMCILVILINLLCSLGMSRKSESTLIHTFGFIIICEIASNCLMIKASRDYLLNASQLLIINIMFIGVFSNFSYLIRDFASLAISAKYKMSEKIINSSTKFNSEKLKMMNVIESPDNAESNFLNDSYVIMVNDGISILRDAGVAPNDRIFTIGFSNPFNLALGTLPNQHDMLWYHFNRSFNNKSKIAFEQAFNSTSFILVPITIFEEQNRLKYNHLTEYKYYYNETEKMIYEKTKHLINSNFNRVATSKNWILFKRRL